MKRRNKNQILMLLALLSIITIVILILIVNINKNNLKCNYDSEIKKYAGKSEEECRRIQVDCAIGYEYFSDECGCGCKLIQGSNGNNNLEEHFCTEESRNADVCYTIYRPVCGWFNPEKIQCIKYPCAETFDNDCVACSKENVLYWTDGKCPER